MPNPSVDLSGFMDCTLPLQVDQVEFSAQPSVEHDVGRVGTDVRVEGEGFIQAADAGTLATALAALDTATSVSGVDFTLTGLGGTTVHQVLAATCLEGGPHVGFQVLRDGSGPSFRRVRFTVAARQIPATVVSAYRYSQAAGPDGLARVGQSGSVVGPGASAYFTTDVLGAFASAHPGSFWLVDYQAEYPFTTAGPSAGLAVRYQIRAQQMADPLPAGGPSAGIVRADVTERKERDEQQRMVATYEFDLDLTTSDYDSVATQLRSAITDPITRESVAYGSGTRRRLRCSFQTLAAADNGSLLNYTQTLTVTTADDAYQEFAYAGADPIAVSLPKVFPRVGQSGTAVGLNAFPQPPEPLKPDFDGQRPTVRYTHLNEYEMSTEWSFQMVDVDAGAGGQVDVTDLLTQIGRGAIGSFYSSGEDDGSGGN